MSVIAVLNPGGPPGGAAGLVAALLFDRSAHSPVASQALLVAGAVGGTHPGLVQDFVVLGGLVTSVEMGGGQPGCEQQGEHDELHGSFKL